MIRSSPSQLYKKNSCSVNPEDGSFNQKIAVEVLFLINLQAFLFSKLHWKL